jgi:hypothetical protein
MGKFLVTLKDRKTDEQKEVLYDFSIEKDSEEEEFEVVEFIWTDGNFGCDCNRYDLFYTDDDIDFPCYNKEYEDGNRFELINIKLHDKPYSSI